MNKSIHVRAHTRLDYAPFCDAALNVAFVCEQRKRIGCGGRRHTRVRFLCAKIAAAGCVYVRASAQILTPPKRSKENATHKEIFLFKY